MKTVVVGVDGSEGAIAAVRWAARLAGEIGAPLRLLHASESAETVSVMLPVPVGLSGAGLRRPGPPADRIIEAAAGEAGLAPEVSATKVSADPVRALLDESAEAELLVLGTRDRGRLATAFAGSVSGKVVAEARCPVIVVRGDADPAGPVVVAVDPAGTSDAALDFAFREAARRDCALFAVHAWQPPMMPAGASALTVAAATAMPSPEIAQQSLTDTITPWREAFPQVAVHERLLSGHPHTAVPDETAGAALVVVGSRGRAPMAGLLLGSTSQALLHRSTCPVAVVRQTDGDDE